MAPVLERSVYIKLDWTSPLTKHRYHQFPACTSADICEGVGKAYSQNADIGDYSNKVVIAGMSKNFQNYQQNLAYNQLISIELSSSHTLQATQVAASSMSVKISDTVDLLPKALNDCPVVSERVRPDVKTGRAASSPPTIVENRILMNV